VAEALPDCAREDPWVRELLGHARELIAPPQGGDGSATQDNLLLAAALVLAAILALPGHGRRRR
jgi:hypothetical protein